MKIAVVPDSFKGSLAAAEVAAIVCEELQKAMPESRVIAVPVADGGEGTLDCFAAFFGGERITVPVTGPNFQKVSASFLLKGDTAVIEMAQAAGLPLAQPKSAGATTTFGVGELMAQAEKRGAKHFVIGIGGSATNDGGCGLAAALGAEFRDASGKVFVPTGDTLCNIDSILFPQPRDITVLCDVKNSLYGENGAAYVYAPQKGASKEDVERLDAGLRHFAGILQSKYNKPVASLPGAGAAGGLGAGLVAFFGAKLRRGIDTVLDYAAFDETVRGADWIITGEGALDDQSFCGKVIDGVMSRTGQVPVIALVGISKLPVGDRHGLAAVFESNPRHLPFESVLPTAREDLHSAAAVCAGYIALNS